MRRVPCLALLACLAWPVSGLAADARPAVTLYTASWCEYCVKLRSQFRERQIPYREIDVETTREGREFLAQLPVPGVPVVKVGEQSVVGMDDARLQSLLEQAGY